MYKLQVTMYYCFDNVHIPHKLLIPPMPRDAFARSTCIIALNLFGFHATSLSLEAPQFIIHC